MSALDAKIIDRLDALRAGKSMLPRLRIASGDIGTKLDDPRWLALVAYCDRYGMTRVVNRDGSVLVSRGYQGEQLGLGV